MIVTVRSQLEQPGKQEPQLVQWPGLQPHLLLHGQVKGEGGVGDHHVPVKQGQHLYGHRGLPVGPRVGAGGPTAAAVAVSARFPGAA